VRKPFCVISFIQVDKTTNSSDTGNVISIRDNGDRDSLVIKAAKLPDKTLSL
jgi:hypothetical protein